MNPYNYQHNTPIAQLYLKVNTGLWLNYMVEFPTAHHNKLEANNIVRGEYYQPVNEVKMPLVILVHGMGDLSVIPCRLLARALAKQGIACFILYSVFHSSRISEPTKNKFPALSLDEWFESYRVSVIDIRQVLDWDHTRPELNNDKIAIIGISYGGSVSSIAMGVDKRIKAGIFIVTGGNSEKMIWLSKGNRHRTKYQRSKAEYNAIQDDYRKYLAEVSKHGFEHITPTRQSYLTDPMTFASDLHQRPVFMINAIWDTYVPRETVVDFWQACGKPAIKWFVTGHTSIWLWYPVIRRQISSFIRSSLFNDSNL